MREASIAVAPPQCAGRRRPDAAFVVRPQKNSRNSNGRDRLERNAGLPNGSRFARARLPLQEVCLSKLLAGWFIQFNMA